MRAMMKKAVLLIVFCLLMPLQAVYGAPDGQTQKQYLVDEAQILTKGERTELEQTLEEYSAETQFDIVIVTIESLDGKTGTDYADDYYDTHGYSDDGILLLISMGDKEWAMSTTGRGITAIHDEGLQKVQDAFLDGLKSGAYEDAFMAYADTSRELILNARGVQIDENTKNPSQKQYLVDKAEILTKAERTELAKTLKAYSKETKCDIVVAVVDSLNGKSAEAYADDFYDYNGYGQGDDNDGILMLVSMGERKWAMSTTGYGITAITDAGLDLIEEEFLDSLSDGAYMDAFMAYADTSRQLILDARDGNIYTGPDYTMMVCAVVTFLIGIGGSILRMLMLKRQLKSVYERNDAESYNSDLELTVKEDRFSRSGVDIVYSPQKKDDGGGGSSTHVGSSGTTHGGSSGSF